MNTMFEQFAAVAATEPADTLAPAEAKEFVEQVTNIPGASRLG